MIVWPNTLPTKLLYSGANEQMGDVRLRAQTDSGPGKARPRFSRAIDTLRCSMIMTFAQKERFKTFVRSDLGQGTLPFTFPKPQVPGETIIAMIGDNMPSFTPMRPGNSKQGSPPLWKVDFMLDVMPQ